MPLVLLKNSPGIYDYYTRFIKDWQHEQMAAHYIEIIADGLKEFDDLLTGNTKSNQFYKDLAWRGLKGTVSWNEMEGSEQERINNTYSDYAPSAKKDCP